MNRRETVPFAELGILKHVNGTGLDLRARDVWTRSTDKAHGRIGGGKTVRRVNLGPVKITASEIIIRDSPHTHAVTERDRE